MKHLLSLIAIVLIAGVLSAQGDLEVIAMDGISNFNPSGGHDAFAMSVTTCNSGANDVAWSGTDGNHPVFMQKLYRLFDNRYVMIGASWARHGFLAVPQSACGTCNAAVGNTLPSNCADEVSAGLSAAQAQHALAEDVNPQSGALLFPPTGFGTTGDATFKRLRVPLEALDATLYPGARYFMETQVVSADDVNRSNDQSWREVSITGGPNNYLMSTLPTASIQSGEAAIVGYRSIDPSVQIVEIPGPTGGRFVISFRGIPEGDGIFRYEFTLLNVDVPEGAQGFRFTLPNGAQVSDLAFDDVDAHSGDPKSTVDWSSELNFNELRWSTTPASIDPLANSLGWGRSMSFSVTSDLTPTDLNIDIAIELFDGGGEIVTTIPPVSILEVVSGDGQRANASTPFLDPIEVRVSDTTGAPVSGAIVNFSSIGAAAVNFGSSSSAVTNAAGIASILPRGEAAAGTWEVEASSTIATNTASFSGFQARLNRILYSGASGLFVLRFDLDMPMQPILLALEPVGPSPVSSGFGAICTSLLAPQPGLILVSGDPNTPGTVHDPNLVISSAGTLTRVYTGLTGLAGMGELNLQAYAARFVGANLDVWVSNCVTNTY